MLEHGEGRCGMGEEVVKRLKEFASKLLEKGFGLRSLVLFGSRARGDHLRTSDADVLLILETDEDFLKRIRRLSDFWCWESGIPIEPFPYTPEEVVHLINKGSITIYDALEHGVVIYDDGTFARLRAKFREALEKGVVRRGVCGWWELPRGRVV